MDLFEYEGKQLFRRFDIPVPDSELIADIEKKPQLEFPYVLKAQTMTGGRGKAGGIQPCTCSGDFDRHAPRIMGMKIKGYPVYALLAEKMVKPDRELYLSITLQGVRNPTLIASAMGGMEIENVAAEHPEEILRMEIDPFIGLKDYQLRDLAKKLALRNDSSFREFILHVQKLFFDCNAQLVEINPLGVFDGRLMAMDAKVALDNHAQASHTELFKSLEAEREAIGFRTPKGDGTTITYVPLDGEIGLISDGAGTGMLTLDLLNRAGGTVASFCELGGTTNADVMYKAMEYTLQKKVKSVLVVLIGGFNRMDDMANGMTNYLAEHPSKVPLVTRMCGTMEEEGLRIMESAALVTCRDLMEAVQKAVNAAKGAE